MSLIAVGMVLAEKESLLVSVIYSEIENRIIVKVGDAAQVKGVHAGKLVQELAKSDGRERGRSATLRSRWWWRCGQVQGGSPSHPESAGVADSLTLLRNSFYS